ncbi:MAG: nucleotidyltransferase domain-containing protein [Chlorogloeopsis fritschii C42_A2020_084]|uniref:nucleotidyltransferase domain-containing protein n=1 Tax=Chlorogloeopsis fritschii TaxID=1124 RepID=UPI0019E98FE9|nr:nucleotidyltransferase domain-containing protein [Chlorogloeopsis fritschii]MBF2008267.1 nucleotidyltransferase domain-containing protein [Chlorogloeopsis fritschii C42_A2020_084]
MNDASKRLLALARKNAASYLVNPKVKAIGIAGSVARGKADIYSDIDMSIYYNELPTDEELKVAYEQNQGSNYRLHASDRQAGYIVEQYFVQGVKCDFGHITIECCERDIDNLLEQCNPDDPLLNVLAGIVDMLPLYNGELLAQWQKKVANYPDKLAQAMVKKHLHFRALWVLQIYGIERDDVLFLTDELLNGVKNIIGVLLGLNRLYHPINSVPFKGMDKFFNKMAIAPNQLSFRLQQIFREEPQIAVNQLGELIEEIFVLVKKHMPEVDTTEAWHNYKLWSDKFYL